MKYTQFEKNLQEKIEKNMIDATPGVCVQVHMGGKKICDIQVGKTYAYYDLASLTKIIFTVQAMILAFEEKRWSFANLVKDFLPWFPHEEVKISQLLSHTSGLSWWEPFYKMVPLEASRSEKWERVKHVIRELPRDTTGKAVYSDVGFILLGFILEEIYEKPLLNVWQDLKEKFYRRSTLHFQEDNIPLYDKRLYAPTEDCVWRKKILQGEVHDDNTWALGGIAPHAGLFGSIDDLGWYALLLRSQLLGIPKTEIKPKTFKHFVERAIPEEVGDWAWGYMLPTKGASSSGKYFSMTSIGHTGFTGTSFWYDLQGDLSVSILSNRVLMGRENESFRRLRPQIHDWIMEGLRR